MKQHKNGTFEAKYFLIWLYNMHPKKSYSIGFHFNQTFKLPSIYVTTFVYGQQRRQKYGNLTSSDAIFPHRRLPCQFIVYIYIVFSYLIYFLFLILPQWNIVGNTTLLKHMAPVKLLPMSIKSNSPSFETCTYYHSKN